jgi:uncharacterized repeat protein (TIGR03803 family)
MEACIKKVFHLHVLIAGIGLIMAGRVSAQTFTTLLSFNLTRQYTVVSNEVIETIVSDGANPIAGLILSGNTLYGTTQHGGSENVGTVFGINTDGTGFTNLHSFTVLSGRNETNSDGADPYAGLILSGNTVYGTASEGGTSGAGTIFVVNTDGTGFTNLHSFAGSDGAVPYGGLVLSSNTLYGTASEGGTSGDGTVFSINTDGSDFTNLYSFSALGRIGVGYPLTNSDGAYPDAGLILSGNTLYGTATIGGSSDDGTFFSINTDGSGFTNPCNCEVASFAALILSSNTLYGTTPSTVFSINTDGTGFTNLYSFGDGANLYGGLILSGNTLYGTTPNGGSSGNGTVFAINTDGSGFTNLYSFTTASSAAGKVVWTNSDGINPEAGLILSGNTLYGTAFGGGVNGLGTVFSLSFAPQLTIILSGANVILTWPTNVAGFDYSGFTLQSTTNLAPPVFWTAVSPSQVVVNGQNTVTNPISTAQQFYQLVQ